MFDYDSNARDDDETEHKIKLNEREDVDEKFTEPRNVQKLICKSFAAWFMTLEFMARVYVNSENSNHKN